MDQYEMENEIARLRNENAALVAKAGAKTVHGLSLRVSTKGALSVYGVGRFPVTLYASQWETVLNHGPDIIDFLVTNKDKLAFKDK